MKYIVIIVFCIISSISFAQTITGVYSIYPLTASDGEHEISEEGKKPMTYSYLFNNNCSLQRLISNEKSVETIITDTISFGKTYSYTRKSSRPSDVFRYKDFDKNIYRMEYTMDDKKTAIADKLPKYEWKFYEVTKIVAGYICKKATTEDIKMGRKQNIVAWYTEDINISDGPSDFNGLPGLILELEIDDLTRITFEEIEFQPSINTPIVEPIKTSTALTVKEFEKINFGIE